MLELNFVHAGSTFSVGLLGDRGRKVSKDTIEPAEPEGGVSSVTESTEGERGKIHTKEKQCYYY